MKERREFLKWLAAAPTLGALAAGDLFARAQKALGVAAKGNIYSRIGVTPVINARGTYTYMSGSLELPEVRAAKAQAALHFVDMWELQRAAGRRLTELSGAESGMVTAGAAAAMSTAAAACMAGADPVKIWQLPDNTGMKSEVVMHGGRISFDNAIRLAGAKLVLALNLDELKRALNERTAMVYTTAEESNWSRLSPSLNRPACRFSWIGRPDSLPSRTCRCRGRWGRTSTPSAAVRAFAARSARDCCWAARTSLMPLWLRAARGRAHFAGP